jgi:hypothetical protein
LKIFVEKDIRCDFGTNSYFNNESLNIINKHRDTYQVKLIDDKGQILVSVPTMLNQIGEYMSLNWAFPNLNESFICKDNKYLKTIHDIALHDNINLNILGVISSANLPHDSYLNYIEIKPIEILKQNYSRNLRKKINKLIKLNINIEYKEIKYQDIVPLVNYWYKLYNNNSFNVVKELHEVWEKRGILRVYGIFIDKALIGGRILLYDNNIVHSLLVPWYKDNTDIRKLELGHYANIKTINILANEGIEILSLGDGNYENKREWATKRTITCYIGTGKCSFRNRS